MVKKYLRTLNAAEATAFIMDNDEMCAMISEEIWAENKYQGPRLAKIAENNSLICKKA